MDKALFEIPQAYVGNEMNLRTRILVIAAILLWMAFSVTYLTVFFQYIPSH